MGVFGKRDWVILCWDSFRFRKRDHKNPRHLVASPTLTRSSSLSQERGEEEEGREETKTELPRDLKRAGFIAVAVAPPFVATLVALSPLYLTPGCI
ncbi:hypothetical protein NL676_025561 [Syzygium grande]|nr:hypothetical protein NL676_025561 [Syzygium grande]